MWRETVSDAGVATGYIRTHYIMGMPILLFGGILDEESKQRMLDAVNSGYIVMSASTLAIIERHFRSSYVEQKLK